MKNPIQIFNGVNITLQSVRQCQQVFSAALIAHCELVLKNNKEKNYFCVPVPHPFKSEDYADRAFLDYKN